TPVDAGIYFAAAKTMSLIMFVPYAVGSALANRFAALNARGDADALEATVRDAVRWTFSPSLAGAVLILAVGRPVSSLFAPDCASAHVMRFVLAGGLLFRASVGPAEFLLNILGAQRWSACVLVTAAALDTALLLALVPTFGVIGAATATAVSLAAAAAMNYGVARWRLGLSIGVWDSLLPASNQAVAKYLRMNSA